MNKIIIFNTLLFLCSIKVISQVGINTSNPQGIYHLDGASSVTTTNPLSGSLTDTHLSDDIIIESGTGNVALGTLPSSTSKLRIKGQLKMTDGTEGTDKIMMATSNGIAYWGTPKMLVGEKIGYWSLKSQSGNLILNASEQQVKGITALGVNTVGLTNGTNQVTVPAGRYLIVINGDVGGHEFGYWKIKRSSDNAVIFSILSRSWLSGFCDYYEFTSATTLYVTYTPILQGSIYWSGKAVGSGIIGAVDILFLVLKQ